jgi:hypothetical protein
MHPSQMEPVTSLESLPTDAIACVLSHVPTRALARLALCNAQWSSLVRRLWLAPISSTALSRCEDWFAPLDRESVWEVVNAISVGCHPQDWVKLADELHGLWNACEVHEHSPHPDSPLCLFGKAFASSIHRASWTNELLLGVMGGCLIDFSFGDPSTKYGTLELPDPDNQAEAKADASFVDADMISSDASNLAHGCTWLAAAGCIDMGKLLHTVTSALQGDSLVCYILCFHGDWEAYAFGDMGHPSITYNLDRAASAGATMGELSVPFAHILEVLRDFCVVERKTRQWGGQRRWRAGWSCAFVFAWARASDFPVAFSTVERARLLKYLAPFSHPADTSALASLASTVAEWMLKLMRALAPRVDAPTLSAELEPFAALLHTGEPSASGASPPRMHARAPTLAQRQQTATTAEGTSDSDVWSLMSLAPALD